MKNPYGLTEGFRLLFASSVATLALVSTNPAHAAPPDVKIIRVDRLITDSVSPVKGPSMIRVVDGKIASIMPDDGAIPTDVSVIDLSGYTVMPGLIDTHVHLTADPKYRWDGISQTREYAVAIALHNANSLVQAGFTTVRDLGMDQFVSQAVRDAVAAGLEPGPRVISAAKLAIIGGHAEPVALNPKVMDALDGGTSCTGVDECAAKVRTAVRNGAQAIKVMATGGSMTPTGGPGQAFSDAELKSIVETAHRLGIRVAAHCSGADGVAAAAKAGVDTIEHATFGQEPEAKLMKKLGISLVPTLSAQEWLRKTVGTGIYPPRSEEKNADVVKAMGRMFTTAYKEGVRIVFGTDAGVYPHGENAGEADLMFKFGMSAPEIIASATTGAADALDLTPITGSLAVGKSADIIAVKGDPLVDVGSLHHVKFVMAAGRIVRNDKN